MRHWRLKTWTAVDPKIYIGWYCLEYNVGAMGWCLWNARAQLKDGSITVNSVSDYMRLEQYETPHNSYWTDNQLKSVEYLDSRSGAQQKNAAQTDDLIWMYNKRHSGDNDSDYYIARVEKDSKYYYEISDEAYDNDACNQLTNLHWLKVGKASDVHDGIVSSLRNRGCTFRRISVAPIEYSQRIYNELTDTNYYRI